ncbi:site-specific integrase [Limnobacter sp. P1]|uniref:site-specific integrase n=1 Tax=Limnobacter olei TaxID=3031298 RepID=UPI0023AF304E|nr:site-specific integrase [Limnobacter sp. P1]
MSRLIKFSKGDRRTTLVDDYFYASTNVLRDLIVSIRPHKAFLGKMFIDRWKRLQTKELQVLNVPERLLVSLFVNDLVLRLDLLEAVVRTIAANSVDKFAVEGRVSVVLEDGLVMNVLISAATSRLITKHYDDLGVNELDVEKTLTQIDKWFWGEESFESFVGGFALVTKQYLPPVVFASVAGFLEYESLEERVFKRANGLEHTFQADVDEINDYPALGERSRQVENSDWWFAHQMQDRLRDVTRGFASKNSILIQIDTDVIRLVDPDTVGYMYLDWVRYLIVYGSRHKSILKPSTIEQYARLVFRHLLEGVNPQLSVFDFVTQHLKESELPTISDVAGSSAPQLNAGMDVFKRYLADVYLIETDIAYMKGYKGMIEAEVIWPSEISKAIQQARTIPDRILSVNCSVAFVLATLVRLRIGELLRLEIRDFQISELEQSLLVNIRHSKSDAGERTVRIPLDQARLLLQFLTYRINIDRADSKASLWGNYETEDVYRSATFRATLNGILKLVTGEPGARFHWLSHAKATSEFWQLFSGRSQYLQHPNPVFAIAADLGHLSYCTSWTTYTHCVDHLIALAARNLWGSIPREYLPSWDFRVWLSAASINTYKSTVRRGNSRGLSTGQSHARLIYRNNAKETSPPFDQSLIQFPSFDELWPVSKTAADLKPVDVFKIACALTDVDGIDPARLMQQFGIDNKTWNQIYWVLGQYGRFESVSALYPDELRYLTHLVKAFSHGFRRTTEAMLLALASGAFNQQEDYFYLREIFTSRNLVVPPNDPRFKKLIAFLKSSGVEPEQCSFEVGVLVNQSDSDQLINLFKYTYLRAPRVSYCKGSARKQVRLHVFKPDLRSTSKTFNGKSNALVSGVTARESRPGNRAAIGICLQAALFCQVVVWDIHQRGKL